MDKNKIIKGVFITFGVYICHRVAKAVYRRGYTKKPKTTDSDA